MTPCFLYLVCNDSLDDAVMEFYYLLNATLGCWENYIVNYIPVRSKSLVTSVRHCSLLTSYTQFDSLMFNNFNTHSYNESMWFKCEDLVGNSIAEFIVIHHSLHTIKNT